MRTGLIAVVGRPNVGKSTLVNLLVGAKISITSSKPQTTRDRILGVRTLADAQFVFADTPGFQTRHRSALNAAMNRTVTETLADMDAVVWVVEAMKYGEADEQVLRLLPKERPVILAVNKIDQVEDKAALLPFLEAMAKRFDFAAIVPVSALKPEDGDYLLEVLKPLLPEAAPMFEEDAITDRSERFLAAEILREKVFRLTGDEIPYAVAVTIEKFEEEPPLKAGAGRGLIRIAATIWIEREGHKPILLGRKGEKLKRIATEARQDMERLFGAKVFLDCWVKVKGGWTDNIGLLKRFGYG
ncbi:GTP-binding protein Era [Sulfuritortus calidifontis]|uniref:GTPase Era n=1 Tax=Sulfuritortus calidifontis TaxID=1914471 RepID=A0A4R3JT70_9PROT|nr:GTPase Era [Sulfuritortus calidifontis]TCS70440.1 GTP-binding protein Era [Sulfuritortus calidifontis]